MRTELLRRESITCLRSAGWSPQRDVSHLVVRWESDFFSPNPFCITEAARAALTELGGLWLEQSGPGRSVARRSFGFDPTAADGEQDRFIEFENALDIKLCPIGEADNRETYLAMGDSGQVLCLMDDAWILGDCIETALNSLILGELGESIHLD